MAEIHYICMWHYDNLMYQCEVLSCRGHVRIVSSAKWPLSRGHKCFFLNPKSNQHTPISLFALCTRACIHLAIDVVPQDITKPQSPEILVYGFPIALKFDRNLGSRVAEKRFAFCSNTNFISSSLAASGGRLKKKDGLTRYGDSHVKDKTSWRPSYL